MKKQKKTHDKDDWDMAKKKGMKMEKDLKTTTQLNIQMTFFTDIGRKIGGKKIKIRNRYHLLAMIYLQQFIHK